MYTGGTTRWTEEPLEPSERTVSESRTSASSSPSPPLPGSRTTTTGRRTAQPQEPSSEQTVTQSSTGASSSPSASRPGVSTTTTGRLPVPPSGGNRKPYIANPIGRIEVCCQLSQYLTVWQWLYPPGWVRGTPFPLVHLLPHLFPFYFSLSFIGFTSFLLLSIPSLSTRKSHSVSRPKVVGGDRTWV